jgi:hypothetical protein
VILFRSILGPLSSAERFYDNDVCSFCDDCVFPFITRHHFVTDSYCNSCSWQIEFKFKCKAGGTTKAGKPWARTVAIFDAKGKPAKNIKEIWGGTEGKVSFTASPYFVAATGTVGLSLRLEAVQILKLVAGSSRDAAGYGFGEEEGDFDATEETQGFVDETDSDDTSDENEDF